MPDGSVDHDRPALNDLHAHRVSGFILWNVNHHALADNGRLATNGDDFARFDPLHDDVAQHTKDALKIRLEGKSRVASPTRHEHLETCTRLSPKGWSRGKPIGKDSTVPCRIV